MFYYAPATVIKAPFFIRAYIRRSGAPEDIGWQVAVKDRQNGAKNPYAHLKLADISIDSVKAVSGGVATSRGLSLPGVGSGRGSRGICSIIARVVTSRVMVVPMHGYDVTALFVTGGFFSGAAGG